MRQYACIAIAALLTGCAGWTKQDTYRQAAVMALLVVDHGQTLNIAKNPETFHENNPILGKHPSVAEVNRYFLAAYVLHPTVSAVLPTRQRRWWQWITIGVEAGVVAHNYSLGIRTDF